MSFTPVTDYIRIRRAYRQFTTPEGSPIKALDGIDLRIAQNEFITLLGPSGCGKTTLLKTIAGFERIDSGDILIDGQSIASQPPHKRLVNTVFQSYALFPHMTVEDNVGYSLDIKNVKKDERNQQVQDILDMVGLAGMEKRFPAQLSGGQQQRVALARAVINRPKLLLLDEPLSALDKNLRLKMQLELKRLQTELGICFIFVTHDQQEALTMSDRIVVLNNGKIQQIGTPDDIYHRPQNTFVANFIGESNLFEGKIIQKNNGETITSCDGITLFTGPTDAETGAEQRILIRPEHFSLSCIDGESALHHLTLTIKEIVFVGTDYQLHGTLQNGKEISALVRTDGDSYHVGQTIPIYYRSSSAHVLSKEKALEDAA
ncbi:ABC transporter ATP-binding protein [Vibrio viridaestus]|uniref:Spermidine/putrescine import ATP-binding protein PotA n=1 Tax=Vibrio viridaestus TaxID=2487322 RepID=A0A3N9TLV1_9VIBR|nr:ABC transporter ATP-binding protein [Vibrio viridaestus]RQW64823.1 ABC transporter ATP-binding protein [Vibrio viridaestus]